MSAVVVVAGCGSGVSPADRLTSAPRLPAVSEEGIAAIRDPAEPEVILPAVWEVAPGQGRGRQVEVRWATSKCALFRRADVIESAETVTITVQEQLVGDGMCPGYRVASHTVTLAAPLGTRTLLDGSVSPGRIVA